MVTAMTKKIINGKKYDVETARLVDRWTYGNPSDFYYQDEMLLCKTTGEYFLYAQGGPLSDYRTYSSPTSWGGGEDIVPFTLYQAKCWAIMISSLVGIMTTLSIATLSTSYLSIMKRRR